MWFWELGVQSTCNELHRQYSADTKGDNVWAGKTEAGSCREWILSLKKLKRTFDDYKSKRVP